MSYTLVNTKIVDLTEKATGEDTDEFVINDVGGGNLDRKMGMDGLRIAGSQVSSGELPDARLSSNVALLDAANAFTTANTFTRAGASGVPVLTDATSASTGVVTALNVKHTTSATLINGTGTAMIFRLEGLASGDLEIGRVAFVRDAGDDQKGEFQVFSGDFSDSLLTIDSTGAVNYPQAGAHTNVKIDEDGTGNAITNLDVGTIKSGSSLEQVGIEFLIDGGGSAIATGEQPVIEVPFDCTITSVTMLADVSTSSVVDIWVDSYANYPPTNADTITASAVPTITADTDSQDATLTGWTTSLSKGDVIKYNVDSNDNATWLLVSLLVDKA